VLVVALFSYEIFYALRQVPASGGAPRVGQKAPDFLLLDQNGNLSALEICSADRRDRSPLR
jgi:hypothetical protein